MDFWSSLKLNKTVLTTASLTDAPSDKSYWLSKSPYERLQALEALRQMNYGYRQSPPRLQRIIEIVQMKNRGRT